MKIGYACIFLGEEAFRLRTCTKKYINDEKLQEIIEHNLKSLRGILAYNATHHIQMFRLSSDLIPFGSSPINTLDWKTRYQKDFEEIGDFIKQNQLRVSLHPGQYTILNALHTEIVQRAILDLQYHCAILDLMGLNSTHKMVLHIGGIYQDKQSAIQRFIAVFQTLPANVKKRVVIENDDRYYSIEDVLYISSVLHIPVIFDNLHHYILAPETYKSTLEWLSLVNLTWKDKDGIQKIHYSVQDTTKRLGAHAKSIQIDDFLSFVSTVPFDLDIMLEVKDKNISACKAQYCLEKKDETFYEEWYFYQYLFYLHSLVTYTTYDSLFKERKEMDRYAFYKLSECYIEKEVPFENYRMFFQFLKLHWKPFLSKRSQDLFERYLISFQNQKMNAKACIDSFYRMAIREHLEKEARGLLLL